MTENAVTSLLSIVRLSLILMGLICVLALTRDRKSTRSFWGAIVKLFNRFL
jgi:hypothetical protein